MNKKTITKRIALFMAMLIGLECLPVEALAVENQVNASTYTPTLDINEEETPIEVVGELEDQRSAYTKSFRLSDGTISTVEYESDVHYKNEDGEWQPIDNSLIFEDAQGNTGAEAEAASLAAEVAENTENTGDTQVQSSEQEVTDPSENAEDVEENEDQSTNEVSKDNPNGDLAAVQSQVEQLTEVTQEQGEVTANSDEDSIAVQSQSSDDVEETDGYKTEAGKVNFKFAKNANQKNLVRINQGKYKLSIALQKKNKNKAVEIEDMESVASEDNNTGDLASQMVAENISSSVIYKNIQDGIDLQYVTSGSDLKENIIVNQTKENYQFSFEIKAQNLAIKQENNTIVLYDSSTNQQVYEMPAMYMEDSNGEQSDSITYSLTQKNKKKYTLTITADAAWINAKERKLPVIIDPSLDTSNTGSGMEKTEIFNYYAAEGGSVYNNGRGFLGYDSSGDHLYRHVVQFKNLPSLPRGSVVAEAKMYYAQLGYSTTGQSSLCIAAKEIPSNDKPWKKTQTWSNLPAISNTVSDYQYLSKNTTGKYVGWDITELVKKRYKANDSNYSSFALVNYDESTLNNKKCAKATIDQSNTNGKFKDGHPILQITYRDTRGIEDYYTNTSQSIGQAGTAYIGDYNNQLTLIKNDLSNNGSVMDFVLSHVYNSTVSYANFTTDANMHTNRYTNMNIGSGWRLSVQETVVPFTIGSKKYYIYSDGDGTEHYFYYNDNDKKYVDEDGLNLTLSFWTASNGYQYITMQDKKGNQKVFINGYLAKIQDSHQNKIFLEYNGNSYNGGTTAWSPLPETSTSRPTNRVTGVVQVNNGSGITRIATLSYGADNYLQRITDRAGRKTTFTYAEASGVKLLTQIQHPDGTTADYKYQAGGYLTDAYDSEGKNGVQYGYYGWPVLGILYVTEYSKDSKNNIVTGAKMSLGYGDTHRKRFRDYGADATANTDDDIVSYTTFDNAGRTVNTISLDKTETKLYGADSSAYTTNDTSSKGNSKSNNRVNADVAIGQQAMNLLVDQSGEKGKDGSAEDWSETHKGTNVSCAVRSDEDHARTGARLFHIWMGDSSDSSEERAGSYSQKIQLKGNTTYTFSGYVSTTELAKAGDVYAKIVSPNGQEIAKSKSIDYRTPVEIEDGWERLSVTFKTSSAGVYSCGIYAENTQGLTRLDDFQLEEADACSSYNMVEDGSMEHDWTWDTDSGVKKLDQTNVHDGSYATKLTGSPSGTQQFWQEIPVYQSSDNTYVLSGWAKANSVPDVSSTSNTTRFFGFYADVNYTDGTKDVYVFSFNPDITDWQYLSGIIVPKSQNKVIKNIYVHGLYNKNANAAWFDGIALKKEPAQTYKYDKEGNLVAVNQKGNTPLTSVYAAGTSDLQSETDGNGTYTYEHNSTTHDVTSVTNDNVKLSLGYDPKGNTTGTTLVNTKTDSTEDSANKAITSTAQYTDDGNYLTNQTDSSGISTNYTNDETKGLVTTSKTGDTTTHYIYEDKTDRQSSIYIGGKISVQYIYENGNLKTIRRGSYESDTENDTNSSQSIHQDYNYTYDSFGNKTSVSVGNRELARYEYAPNNGNLIKTTYANGNTVELVYDVFDRVVEEKYNGTVKYRYVYNGEGDLAKKIEVQRSGLSEKEVNVVNYEYDSLDRLIHSSEERIEDGKTTEVQRSEHIYDGENRITKQSWSVGGEAGRSENYTYSTTDGTLQSMKTANGENISFEYDALKRLKNIKSKHGSGTDFITQTYTYKDRAGQTTDGKQLTTNQIANIAYTGIVNPFNLSYEYDAIGNISKVSQGSTVVAEYQYDKLNQLISEKLPQQNLKYTYTYDTSGNIRTVETTNTKTKKTTTDTYEYTDSDWKDLLTSYNGTAITYDAVGNPLSYNNGTAWKFTWENAHDLATAKGNGKSISYHYDMDGVRDSKTVDGVKHEYITQGGNVTLERWNDGEEKSLEFIYDNGGAPYSVIYSRGNELDTYYYILNQQGDVIRIVDTSGKTVAEYTYNGWGEILNVSNAKGSEIGTLNPIRYRGYYYDSELNMYYLQSRYYDPVMKRMIASDDESLTSDATLNNNNLFAYCDNNPVNRADTEGECWNVVAGAVLGATFNIGSTVLVNMIAGEKTTAKDIAYAGLSGAATGALGGALSSEWVSTAAEVAINSFASGVSEAMSQYSTVKARANTEKRKITTKEKATVATHAIAAAGAAAITSLVSGHKRPIKARVTIKIGKGKHPVSRAATKVASFAASKAKGIKLGIKRGLKVGGAKSNFKSAFKSSAYNAMINLKRWLLTGFYRRHNRNKRRT